MIETDARYAGYSAMRPARRYEEVRRRVAAMPGVQAAALTRGLPMDRRACPCRRGSDGDGRTGRRLAPGRGHLGRARVLRRHGGFPILFGRALDERDRRDTPRVAVISESMARQYFGGADPASVVGRRFRPEWDATASAWIEVVGVARDTGRTVGDLVDPTPQLFYRSFAQSDRPPTTVVARTSLDAAASSAPCSGSCAP